MGSQVTNFSILELSIGLSGNKKGQWQRTQSFCTEEKSNWKERAVEVLQTHASFLLVNHGVLVWNGLKFCAVEAIVLALLKTHHCTSN